jgi:hypothetical protein
MDSRTIDPDTLTFADSKPVKANPDRYIEITVDTAKIVESWSTSLYSFEWLYDGQLKSGDDLKPSDREKQRTVLAALDAGETLERPVLGIGIQDNAEIGSGKVTFLTLTALGVKTLPVNIPKSCETDFKDFRTD